MNVRFAHLCAMLSPALRAVSLLLIFLLTSCASVNRERARIPAMERTYAAWQQVADTGAQPRAIQAYRDGVEDVLKELVSVAAPDDWPASITLNSGWTIKIDQGQKTHAVWTPLLFDALSVPKKLPASPVKGSIRVGLGLPLEGLRVDDNEDAHSEFLYDERQYLPVTAVLEFDAKAKLKREANLRLYDPREVQKVKVSGRSLDLAADFATPVHTVLARRSFVRRALGGFFRPDRFMDQKSLFIQEPYRADKVPVVFVHGLASDPHIWQNAVVAIMSDPELGRKVQCWCFIYPTALPVPSSAARLRSSLSSAQAAFDPDNNDPGMQNMMLVGHSMGGLLSRMQVIDSGDAFWQTWFKVRPDDLPLDAEISQQLKDSLLFKANPKVKRVVFIATPHRGSLMADGWIGRMGSSLIRLPVQVVQAMTSIASLDVELLNPDRLQMRHLGADSINGLSPQHPIIQALEHLPIKAPSHSIIAVVHEKPRLEETSDGVVPYISSHLRQAKSEATVRSGHSCANKPATVKELIKLVRLHVGLK